MRRISIFVVLLLVALYPVSAIAQTEGAPCSNEPTDQGIAYGQVVTCTISPVGDTDIFRFLAVGNERIVIQMTGTSGSVDPCITLISPSNSRLAACGAPSVRIVATLNEPGMHSIVCAESGTNEIGNYTLSLERVIPPSPSATVIGYAATRTDRLDPLGEPDLFTFTAPAGSSVTLTATASGSAVDPCIDLIAPDSAITTGCSSPSASLSVTLAVTGAYAVLINDSGQNELGNYTLTLQCDAGPCAAQQLTITIPATSPWVDTGIDVAAGQAVGIRATAEWKADPAHAFVGPTGRAEPCDPQSSGCPIHANHAALVGRIGSDPSFLVGEAFGFLAPSSGRLYLMINDDVNALGDNTGSATVHVLYSAPPLAVDLPGATDVSGLLGAPAPNPFVESSELRFRVARPAPVTLRVYDMAGRLVRSLYDAAPLEVGEHIVTWDGRGDDGLRSAPGVYFYRLGLPGHEETRRAILLR